MQFSGLYETVRSDVQIDCIIHKRKFLHFIHTFCNDIIFLYCSSSSVEAMLSLLGFYLDKCTDCFVVVIANYYWKQCKVVELLLVFCRTPSWQWCIWFVLLTIHTCCERITSPGRGEVWLINGAIFLNIVFQFF